MSPLLPKISISHKARSIAYDRTLLERLVAAALPRCFDLAKKNNAELLGLPSVEISILGSRAMAKVHRDFLDIHGATDVMTFPYGEVLVCAPIAAARSPEFGYSTTEELALYIIHGLLHLSGFNDISEPDAQKMATAQQEILKCILSETR
ncbi:MAG: rRNA maturation RNase YbeY [bacterium]